MRTARCCGLSFLLIAVYAASTQAEVVVKSPGLSIAISDQGQWLSIKAADGIERCAAALPLAVVYCAPDNRARPCNSAVLTGDQLKLGFAGVDTKLICTVQPAAHWILFTLKTISGTRPQRVMLCQAPIAITAHVGRRLDIAWNDNCAVCLLAATRQCDCRATGGKYARLQAMTQDAPGPKLEGSAVALIACPRSAIEGVLKQASHVFGLLTNEDANGTPVKYTDLARGSYWFITLGEGDAAKMIDYCRRTDFHQVMITSNSWCTSPGHYLFNTTRFPDGLEGLKHLVDKLHQAGIKVGMHCFASKVSKRDPYVTPIPDRRFWVNRRTQLAADITPDQKEIKVVGDLRQWPGSPVCRQKTWEGGVQKHREVIIDNEIIQYQSIGPAGVYDTFEGCRRGAWGTHPAAHKAGAEGRHYGVDGGINGYIIDQDTSLLDETTTRLANIFNYCGFDMVYFDGGEDVPRTRFDYYVSRFQEMAMRKFKRRPIIHMGTIMTQLLWNSFARSSTVDTYLNTLHGAIAAGREVKNWPTVRQHIDRSVKYMLSVRDDLMPGELGWFGIWPKGPHTDGLQLDEIEYLMCKSLGYDVPISLETSFSQMQQHVLTPEILKIVGTYERLRMTHAVDEATRARLRQLGQDFALIQHDGKRDFVAMQVLPKVAGTHDVRALVGAMPGAAVATVWHYLRTGTLTVPLPADRVRVLDFDGHPVPIKGLGNSFSMPVGHQRYAVLLRGGTVAQLRAGLEAAKLQLTPMIHIFIPAATGKLVGKMALGSQVGVHEPGALGDVVVCTGRPSYRQPHPWYAEYTVQIPHDGVWTLWARVRYPSGTDESFGVVRPGEQVTLAGDQVLGNCGVNHKRWHWTGRGGGSTTVPPGAPIRFLLKKGLFTFRIYAREGGGTAQTNPRLDMLCLSDDSYGVPTDEMARERRESF